MCLCVDVKTVVGILVKFSVDVRSREKLSIKKEIFIQMKCLYLTSYAEFLCFSTSVASIITLKIKLFKQQFELCAFKNAQNTIVWLTRSSHQNFLYVFAFSTHSMRFEQCLLLQIVKSCVSLVFSHFKRINLPSNYRKKYHMTQVITKKKDDFIFLGTIERCFWIRFIRVNLLIYVEIM